MTKFKVANNQTSYDTGNKPFKPDAKREIWSSNWDFFGACVTHSFDIRNFSIIPLFITQYGAVFFLLPYTIGLFLFIIPILFIQSFMGQFSSSGFISVFRISPLFKGIGYVILVLNLTSAMYSGIFVGLPLIYFFASFSPTLPWMHCGNSWNTAKCMENFNKTVRLTEFELNETVSNYNSSFDDYSDDYWERTWPSLEFLRVTTHSLEEGGWGWDFAWQLFLSNILVWVILAYALTRGVQTFGKFMRYTAIALFTIVVILVIRLLFVNDALEGIGKFLVPHWAIFYRIDFWLLIPYIAATAFGSGWSTTLSLASYNSFKCDIGKIAIMTGFTHMLLTIICSFIVFIADKFIESVLPFHFSIYGDQPVEYVYTAFPLFLGSIGWSNLWLLFFFFMLSLGAFSSLAIQLFSILTALFDEFEQLRTIKRETTITSILILGCTSIFFCSNYGITIAIHLYESTSLSQMIICFFELMVVVWVYGRIRFQRDVEFMLGQIYPTWRFYLLRFITPFYIFLTILVGFFVSMFRGMFYSSGVESLLMTLSLFVKLTPIICIPGYVIIKLSTSSGTFFNRFKRLCRPNDWHPANKINSERYEVTVGNLSDMAQQLIVEDYEEP